MFAALEEQRAALAGRVGSAVAGVAAGIKAAVSPSAKKEEGAEEVKPAATLVAAAAASPPEPPKEEPEDNYGALAFA